MLPRHIKSASDLKTTHQAIYDGFLKQAVAKVDQADPFVERAKRFYKALNSAKTAEDVLALKRFRNELVSASGFSDKGKSKFSESELEKALKKVLKKNFRESNQSFREELVYRYLLTKGDTLGGSMRNITGTLASNKFIKLVTKALNKRYKRISLTKSKTGKIQSMAWRKRKLLFDRTPKFIGKNIDIILLKVKQGISTNRELELMKECSSYIACGELKGGIDPAGADEHWKTANSALGRIRHAFPEKTPRLFFIGAAIESAMAKEIFDQLKRGSLDYAANLTKEQQLKDLVDWLVSL